MVIGVGLRFDRWAGVCANPVPQGPPCGSFLWGAGPLAFSIVMSNLVSHDAAPRCAASQRLWLAVPPAGGTHLSCLFVAFAFVFGSRLGHSAVCSNRRPQGGPVHGFRTAHAFCKADGGIAGGSARPTQHTSSRYSLLRNRACCFWEPDLVMLLGASAGPHTLLACVCV